jgi:hypothetical protein
VTQNKTSIVFLACIIYYLNSATFVSCHVNLNWIFIGSIDGTETNNSIRSKNTDLVNPEDLNSIWHLSDGTMGGSSANLGPFISD